MGVRLNIDQIAELLRTRLAMSFKWSFDAMAHMSAQLDHRDHFFAPMERQVIAKLERVIAHLVAERFVQNDQTVPLLTIQDILPFKPGGAEFPIESLEFSEFRSIEEMKFNLFLGLIVQSFSGPNAYALVRKWIQTVLNLSRDHGMDVFEFVKMPGVIDEIVRALYTREEFLAQQNALAGMGGQWSTSSQVQEMIAQHLAKDMGVSVEQARAELQKNEREVQQFVTDMTQAMRDYGQKEANRIYDFKVDAAN